MKSESKFKPGDLVRGVGDDEYSYKGAGIVLRVRFGRLLTNLHDMKNLGGGEEKVGFVCLLDSTTGQQIWLFESRLTLVETDTSDE